MTSEDDSLYVISDISEFRLKDDELINELAEKYKLKAESGVEADEDSLLQMLP